jgi:hypothetical protein
MLLAELPARLTEPDTYWQTISIGVAMAILVALGLILHLVASRLAARWRASLAVSGPQPGWRKIWQNLLTLGLAIAPYVTLLLLSGLVFSILPVGPIPAGLAALAISTGILYRFVRTVALVLLDPARPSARALPIADCTAQWLCNWVWRFTALAATYFFITRGLRTIGVGQEIAQVVRALLIIIIASVLSVLIVRLARMPHVDTASPRQGHRLTGSGVLATLQRLWPIIALAYIWSAALLSMFGLQHEVSFMVAASLKMCLIIGAGMMLLWTADLLL